MKTPATRTTVWQRAEQMPPILVRLFARHPRGKPLTAAEISLRSGLDIPQVEFISWQLDWSKVDIRTMQRFLLGCQCDFTSYPVWNRCMVYKNNIGRRGTGFKYLRLSPDWEKLYQPMLARYLTTT